PPARPPQRAAHFLRPALAAPALARGHRVRVDLDTAHLRGLLNLLFFMPLLLTAVQSGVNPLVEASGLPPAGRSAATAPAAQLRAGRGLRRVWGGYLLVLTGAGLVLTAVAYGIMPNHKEGLFIAFSCAAYFALPLLVGCVSAYWRAGRIGRALAQLEADPG